MSTISFWNPLGCVVTVMYSAFGTGRLSISAVWMSAASLIAKGIPEAEIAFIHDANTETQKAELFAKVRRGQVRVLIGSTAKMGAGTNVQNRIVASHDLDCPWRPADLEQRRWRPHPRRSGRGFWRS